LDIGHIDANRCHLPPRDGVRSEGSPAENYLNAPQKAQGWDTRPILFL
jgi:hypothetical protein